MDHNLVHSRTDGSNDSGHIQRGYLHQMSPSVLHMTKKLETLSLSFPDKLLKALKKIIESPMMGARCHLKDDIYTTISQLQQLPKQSLYRFQLPFDDQHFSSEICHEPSFGFLLLDQQLPDFLTVLCFGGSLSSLVAGAEDSAPDDSSTDSSPPAVTRKLTRIGKQLMDQVARALSEVWRTTICSPYCSVSDTGFSSLAQWMGGALITPASFADDCLLNQFDLEFRDPAYADSPWLVPVCFYTPVNAFTSAMVEQGMVDETGSKQGCRDRILGVLGKIEVDVTVDLEPLSLPVSKLCDLNVGDVLSIPHPGKSHIRVENALLFRGTTGQHGGHLTVVINNCLRGEDSQ
ncbi:FliM/FliN family flagellar motor C-terminal domain-containing protein [Endozoicomonas acroporae]|uniref:FliM/FliN family flagellar motor C-terminal domain-containing protein n=1 Tax=Endozoicomonas acroporae TaxID=1701104 RepID=UPI0013D0626D|nr:FliM/FliN family flagellar motor C-terminal domain-containing protein [Endozoicomonas acroporae]